MRHHLDVLSRLHFVWGVFGMLTGLSLGVLAAGTAAALMDADSVGRTEEAAVWVFAGCATLLVAGGAASLWVGRALRGRRPIGRAAAMVLAVPNLVIVPFGTALGVYAFWVLLNDDARHEFGRPTRGPSGPPVSEMGEA